MDRLPLGELPWLRGARQNMMIALSKDVVETAFKSIRSPLEVLQECKDKLPR